MTPDIDDLIRRPDITERALGLENLEARVWSRVRAHHARVAAQRTQTAALALALIVGAVGGGLLTVNRVVPQSELQVLTVEAGLSPFNLAGGLP